MVKPRKDIEKTKEGTDDIKQPQIREMPEWLNWRTIEEIELKNTRTLPRKKQPTRTSIAVFKRDVYKDNTVAVLYNCDKITSLLNKLIYVAFYFDQLWFVKHW